MQTYSTRNTNMDQIVLEFCSVGINCCTSLFGNWLDGCTKLYIIQLVVTRLETKTLYNSTCGNLARNKTLYNSTCGNQARNKTLCNSTCGNQARNKNFI